MKHVQTTSNEKKKPLKIIIYMLKNTNKRNFHIIFRNIVEFALALTTFERRDRNCGVKCNGNCDENDTIFCILYHGLNDINGRNDMEISTQYQ